MRIGMNSEPFRDEPLDIVADLAEEAGIQCLEVVCYPGSKHIDPRKMNEKKAAVILEGLDDRGLQISALSYFVNTTEPGQKTSIQGVAKRVIDAAALLEVDTVCMLPGFAAKGRDRIETIHEVLPGVFEPIVEHGRKKGVRIAVENYWRTCLLGLDTMEALFDAIPADNFGLNYDPSHLVHQGIDPIAPLHLFGDRIFHTHAKDTLVDETMRDHVGIYGDGWWRYTIPGFGDMNWGAYVSHLRHIGYDGVLSIEHEDRTFDREEGLVRGAAYLEQFV